MAGRRSRYKQMEAYVTYGLLIDLALFILYLIVAAAGIIWLKVILTILTFAASLCILGFLHICGELRRKRSLWMGTAAAAILVCTLASLILNYPSPL